MQRLSHFALCGILLLVSALAGCAYQFQGSRNPLKDLGIKKIYVSSFRNQTYRPGIEQFFTTAMVREIGRGKAFELVNSEEAADAVLSGVVSAADDSIAGSQGYNVVYDLKGSKETRPFQMANKYSASVTCAVALTDKQGRQIFSRGISDSKVHPGTAVPGTADFGDASATEGLVNDSEQRIAIQFLASQMMASLYQRMVDTF